MSQYQILKHPTDLKIKAYGKNLSELFSNMALGLAHQQFKQKEEEIVLGQWEEVEINALDLESLLVDWLNELIYRSNINQSAYLGFDVFRGSENGIHAKIRGIRIPEKFMNIKAATYRDIEIKNQDGSWEAVVAFSV